MAEKYTFPDEGTPTDEIQVDVITENSEVEVEIIDDTPERDRGRKPLAKPVEDPTDDEINSYSDKVKGRIQELTHARHDERRAKEASLREKQELEIFAKRLIDENAQLKQYVDTGSKKYAEKMQESADHELETARRNYKAAQESFDTDAIIAAQEALTDAKLNLISAKNFKVPALQSEENVVQTQQQAPEVSKPDEKTLRWQAKNQWFGSPGNEDLTSFSLGLHQKLVNSGVDPRSDEYFEQIDARMKSTFPDMFGGATKRPSTVVASATRSTGARKIQLTSSQVEMAKRFGMTPQQYALEVAKLEK